VDQVFSQTPLAPHLAQKALSGIDRQAQVGEHAMEPSAAVAQKMEEWLALHAATVSKKACRVQPMLWLDVRPASSDMVCHCRPPTLVA
jgi:hypothetical protein